MREQWKFAYIETPVASADNNNVEELCPIS